MTPKQCAASFRAIKTELVVLTREATDAGAPNSVLRYLNAARQSLEEAALAIDDASFFLSSKIGGSSKEGGGVNVG